MVSHWSLSDSQSLQVSRILLSIRVDLNNVVVCMVSTRPLISMSSSLFIAPLVIVPKLLITIGITVTLMFDSFSSSLARSRYLSLLSLSFSFTQCVAGTPKSTIRQLFFFFCWRSLGLVVWPRSPSPTQSCLVLYSFYANLLCDW